MYRIGTSVFFFFTLNKWQAFYDSTCDAFTSAIAESDVGPKACILCINNGIAAALLPRDSASASSSAVPAADFALSFTKSTKKNHAYGI